MTDLMVDGQRRPMMDFWPRIHRKQISVHLNGQPMITGELTAFSTYEVVVKLKTGREVMIPKGAIVSVDLPENWRRVPADVELHSESHLADTEVC